MTEKIFFIFPGNGPFHYYILCFFALSLVFSCLESLNMSLVAPAAKCALNITDAEQGFLNAVNFIGYVVSLHFWGIIADAWGRKKVLVRSFSLSFLFAMLSSFSTSTIMLIVTRLLLGLR